MRSGGVPLRPWLGLCLLALSGLVVLLAQDLRDDTAQPARTPGPVGGPLAGPQGEQEVEAARQRAVPDQARAQRPSAGAASAQATRLTQRAAGAHLLEAAHELSEELARSGEAEARRHVRLLLSLTGRLGSDMDALLRHELENLLGELQPAELRAAIGRALAQGGPDPALARRLADRLAERDLESSTHEALCAALSGTGGPAVVADLLASRRPGSPERGICVARALERIGGAVAEQGLTEMLLGELDPRVRRAAEHACGALESEALVGRIGNLLPEADPQTAVSLLHVLEERGDPRDSGAVLVLLDRREQQPAVKHAAIRALGTCADQASVERLLRLAEGSGPHARTAQVAIMKLRSPEAIDQAASSWTTLRPAVRHALLHAAVRQSQPSPTLLRVAQKALDSSDKRLHKNATQILKRPR